MTPPTVDGSLCPSCERYIGPADKCPYCDADSARSAGFRILRVVAVVLGVGGLAMLYVAGTRRALPAVRVGDITPMMNYAYVRVVGTVARQPYVSDKGGNDYFSFLVDDGSGSIRVLASGHTAKLVLERGLLPAKGATIDVAGSLNVTAEGEPKLRLQIADQLKAVMVSPVPLPETREAGVE